MILGSLDNAENTKCPLVLCLWFLVQKISNLDSLDKAENVKRQFFLNTQYEVIFRKKFRSELLMCIFFYNIVAIWLKMVKEISRNSSYLAEVTIKLSSFEKVAKIDFANKFFRFFIGHSTVLFLSHRCLNWNENDWAES